MPVRLKGGVADGGMGAKANGGKALLEGRATHGLDIVLAVAEQGMGMQ